MYRGDFFMCLSHIYIKIILCKQRYMSFTIPFVSPPKAVFVLIQADRKAIDVLWKILLIAAASDTAMSPFKS